jgi:hypothetical protein
MRIKQVDSSNRLWHSLPIWAAILILFVTSQCIEPYSPQPLLTEYNYLVVDGFLINGNKPTVIKLSRTQAVTNAKLPSVIERNAIVKIEEEAGNKITLNNNNDGTYSVPSMNLNVSKNYRLTISTEDGKEYASDFVPVNQSPAIDSLNWTEEVDGIRVSIFAHDPENKTTYYLWSYDETWQYSATDYSIYKFENGQIVQRELSNEIYTCWKEEGSNNIYLASTAQLSEDVIYNYKLHFVPQESRMLLQGYSLLVNQHAISREAFNYWTTLKKNNESFGTVFDRMPSRDLGNIHCESHPEELALGFFSATSISTKRIVILRQELLGPHFGYDPSEYSNCKSEIIPLNEINEARLKGLLLIDRKYSLTTQELIGYSASSAFCIDCRLNGGTTTKPSFWR